MFTSDDEEWRRPDTRLFSALPRTTDWKLIDAKRTRLPPTVVCLQIHSLGSGFVDFDLTNPHCDLCPPERILPRSALKSPSPDAIREYINWITTGFGSKIVALGGKRVGCLCDPVQLGGNRCVGWALVCIYKGYMSVRGEGRAGDKKKEETEELDGAFSCYSFKEIGYVGRGANRKLPGVVREYAALIESRSTVDTTCRPDGKWVPLSGMCYEEVLIRAFRDGLLTTYAVPSRCLYCGRDGPTEKTCACFIN